MIPLLAAAIISTTISNASTGGNVVSNGSVVNGSSYSSVSVQTYSNDEGGTSTVEIETDNNGQMNQQTYTKTIPPGGLPAQAGSADIYVATSTGGANVRVESVVGTGGQQRGTYATSTPLASSTLFSSFSTGAAGFDLETFFNSLFDWNWFRFW